MNCVSGAGIPDTRYLASPEFIATTLHWVTIIETPILTYGAYCILFKTPKRMTSVKWLMLNLHFWSCLSDLVISFIGIPYILLPAPAGYGLGLLDSPKLMLYSMVTLLAAIAASVLAIYENRFFMLFAQKSWWKYFRKPYFLVICTMIPLIFLPPYFQIPDQENGLKMVLSKIPCQPVFTFGNRKVFVIAVDLTLIMYCIGIGTLVLATSITLFGFLIFWKLFWMTMSNLSLSARTCHIQKKFATALTIQSTFMVSIVLVPVLTLLWILAKSYHDQALNNFVFIVLSLHGVGSTIMMIFVHKPYREFTFARICCFTQKWKKREREKRSYPASIIL
ncbi:unnamed protein product [Caenorhabditis brenneri]